jgi:uncharacterized repeat protein (TIGR01451 family)
MSIKLSAILQRQSFQTKSEQKFNLKSQAIKVLVAFSAFVLVFGASWQPFKVSATEIGAPVNATIIVKKHVVNDGGGIATADQFTLHITNSTGIGAPLSLDNDFPGSETGTTFFNAQPGQYFVSEVSPLTNYTASFDGCSGSIAAGEIKTCTVTNTYNPPTPPAPTTGTIIVKKVAVGGDGTFNFVGGTGIGNFSLTTVSGASSTTFSALIPGSYSLSENYAEGWTSSGPTCSNGEATVGSLVEGTETLTLAAGETITCTFTNTKNESTGLSSDLSVTKTVGDGLAQVSASINDPETFVITVNNAGPDNDTNVVVHDPIPAGFTVTSSSTATGIYDGTDWTIGSLATGTPVTLTVVGTVASGTTIANTATVKGDNTDPVSTNDSATATINVNSGGGTGTGGGVTSFGSVSGGGSSGGIQTYSLTITKSGEPANGTITSTDGHINCGSNCNFSYAPGTVVTLNATPDTNSSFVGTWSGGGCTGDGICQVTIGSTNVSVNAHFSPAGQVAGAFTNTPSGQVLGETTTLPRTGLPVGLIVLALLAAWGLAEKIVSPSPKN